MIRPCVAFANRPAHRLTSESATVTISKGRQITSILLMDDSQNSELKDTMQRFTATGRPYRPPQPAKEGWSVNSLSVAESFGAGPASLLPTRFTDESLITIPVQRPENIGKVAPTKAKKPLLSFGRKSKDDFLMKQVSRGEYLKYYAKDENGNYIGRQTPHSCTILFND
jgi:hypothetical protein